MKRKYGLFLILILGIFGIIVTIYIDTDQAVSKVPEKLVRLHVVANSDAPADQSLKLKVRDAIIKSMSDEFEGLSDVEQVKNVIKDHLDEIETIGRSVVAKNGKQYAVKAQFGDYDFPTKQYGNLTLPAGRYQALNVVIGRGEGKNWWCVMFPPLCFIDIAHGVAPEKTTDRLKKTLDEEEYDLLVSSKTKEPAPVKIRFKILEIARGFNQRLAKNIFH